MTSLAGEFQTDLTLEDAAVACADAIDGLGWEIDSVEADRIVAHANRETAGGAQIEVDLTASDEGTEIRIIGSDTAAKSISQEALIAELDRARDAIQARIETAKDAAQLGNSSQPDGPPAGWYPDPTNRGVERYWNGTSWGEQRTTGPEQVPDAPSRQLPKEEIQSHRDAPSPSVTSPKWHPDPLGGSGYRYWDGSRWTEQTSASLHGSQATRTVQNDKPVAGWWREHWKGPVIGAVAFLIGVGVGLGDAGTETTTVQETETIEGEVQTETRTVQAPAPSAPSPQPEPSEQADGTYTVDEFTITDVQVSEDGVGDFEVRARVTNNGDAADFVQIQTTLFNQGSVISDLDAIEDFESGQTRTVTFIGTDPFGPYDEVEFTIDSGF